MKALVVYYSFESNTRLIAHAIAEATGADLLELKPKKEIGTHGFMKYVWGGRQVVLKRKPALLPLEKHPQDYDLLFIGTPVWAYSYSPPIRTFFSTANLSGKKIALFCCHGGDKRRTLEKMRESLSGNDIVGEIDFVEPLSRDTDASVRRARDWARNIISGVVGNAT